MREEGLRQLNGGVVDGAGCGCTRSLRPEGERQEDGNTHGTHEGPQVGIRAWTLEPWVQTPASPSSSQFPAYKLEVVTLPTQRVVRFLAAPLLQLPVAVHKAQCPGVSLAGSKHTSLLSTSGPSWHPLFLLGMCSPSSQSVLSDCHLFWKPPIALVLSMGSPPLCQALRLVLLSSQSPQQSGLLGAGWETAHSPASASALPRGSSSLRFPPTSPKSS